jgi:outer membrane protein assembly factor BamE
VFFEGDLLTKIEADALPSEAEFVASLDSGRKTRKMPVLEMSEESLKATAVTAVPVAKPLPPLPASYPPLESSAN